MGRSRSKHRGRRSRSRHRSRSRRRRSRSRSRRRRSRSRSRHRHRSRSRHRSRRSRSRGRRSRSRSHKRRSRSRSADHKASQSMQNEKSEAKGEKVVQDDAKTREKASLIPGSQSSATSGPSKPGGDEFSSLDNVMNSVLEAVAPKPLEKVEKVPPKPSTIIPGTQTFEDLEAFLKRKKSEKLEEMKKNL